jgi:FAD/FMN-containing dehydrogenase
MIGPIKSIRGQILMLGDADYEAARRVFNGMVDRRPKMIIRPADSSDVVRCIAYARAHGLPLSIRGGGHNVAGSAVADGGLVIDHSSHRRVTVDGANQTADAQPGATWYDFDQAAGAHGLATTGGLVSSTGVAGFTLGGGIGWLVRRHGLACDNLIEADVITAEGRKLRAAEDGDGDLLWALRGGGGNFGVVTRFRFRVHPLGPVTGGLLVHPRSEAAELLRFWRDFVREAPEELTTIAALMTTPDGHAAVGLALCHSGSPVQAQRDLTPLRAFGPPEIDHVETVPYTVLQTFLDPTAPMGARNYWKSDFLPELTDDAIDVLVEGANRISSPLSQVHIHHLGGAATREPRGGSAFGHRGAGFVYNLIGMWTDPAEDSTHMAWARWLFDGLRQFSAGAAYVNFLGDDGPERVRAAYGPGYARLAELKRRYDPDNVFCLNQNILPN